MTTTRIAISPPRYQGAREKLSYVFDLSPYTSASSPVIYLMDILEETDYTSTNITGSATVASGMVSTGIVSGLSYGSQYKLICHVNVSGQEIEYYMTIICDRL